MSNILDLNPRLEAAKLSTLVNGCVDSESALRAINGCLEVLNRHIVRVEYRVLYWRMKVR